MDWSGRRRLQREQRELKAPQERSDEEIEAVPAESVRLERKSTASKMKKSENGKRQVVSILAMICLRGLFQCPPLALARLLLIQTKQKNCFV